MNSVFAEVSEATRSDGRTPVPIQVENLQKERNDLVHRKRSIEVELSEIESWRMHQNAIVLSNRLPKSEAIRRTTMLEAQARNKKQVFVREKQAIEERLHTINGRIKNKKPRSENAAILLRIESLLAQLLSRLESS